MVERLRQIGLSTASADPEKVVMLVGPNGSGKSFYLRGIADEVRHDRRELAIISNTAFDRFSRLRGIKRVSASRSSQSPKSVIKRAVADTIEEPNSRFYQIGAALEYCRYEPRFGFKVRQRHDDQSPPRLGGYYPADYEEALLFLKFSNVGEIIWIDQRESPHEFSNARHFAAVLRHEGQLRRDGHLKGIEVYLERKDRKVIELLHASSGELSLISSLVFLTATVGHNPIVLIDEPENSLHPRWQQEYIDLVLGALRYREATLVIATHAPLIVIGALANFRNKVEIFQVDQERVVPVDIHEAKTSSENIEALLWRAFDVITPANHFVSERVLGIIKKLEKREITRAVALRDVEEMSEQSYDDQQQDFFSAINTLINQIDRDLSLGSSQND